MIPKPSTCKGCPLYEKPFGKHSGFSVPSGTGTNGVLIVAEALGRDEEQEGLPLVGKSGYTLFQQLDRVGIKRDGFRVFNTIACRPPDNKLYKMPYERGAIAHCAPNLDSVVAESKVLARANKKTFVIVTLGTIAFKRVMGKDPQVKADALFLKEDYLAYPHWSDVYSCWVIAADHPSYIMRGQSQRWPILQFCFARALEIADNGLELYTPGYLLDPTPVEFESFVELYLSTLKSNPDNPLSYDIETPYKKKTGSEEDLAKEEEADHTILRCSFSFFIGQSTHTASVKWSAEYMSGIERLFSAAPFALGWNSDQYDFPRVSRYCKILGLPLDGMVAWHILNSNLPKGLGFVTPFYVQNTEMWKHMSEASPAYYNAKDADMALRNWVGIKKDLINHKLWGVYERHWIRLSEALRFMSNTGVLRDSDMRQEAEGKLSKLMDEIELRMEAAVPPEARKYKVAKKPPKDLTGWQQNTKLYPELFCDSCGLFNPKRWKKHQTLCGTTTTTEIPGPQQIWVKSLEFKISKTGLTAYQQSLKHQAILSRKERKTTYNEDAMVRLMKDYPSDPLYPNIIEHRKVQKLLSTYIGVTTANGHQVGGMPVGRDGRIHTVYGRNANTLRFTSSDPNLQNLPRPNPKDPTDLVNIIRNLIIAGKGNVLYARDYSGIEAVLTGYFALDPKYIRLAKHDVHTYYTVYALYELENGKRIGAADLPDIDWPDSRLFPYLEELKERFKKERNSLFKHLVHAANFMQGPFGARDKIFSETRVEYPVKTVQRVMDVYYALFPKIRIWHNNVLAEAEKDGYLRNPFDYVCRFSRVFDYKWEMGEWSKKTNPDVSNKVVAFKPQSTAVGIITEAILRLYFNRFEEAGQFLRLQVHDELLFEAPKSRWENLDKIVKLEMERPVLELPVPPSWEMGNHLAILTEAKVGLTEPSRWGTMKGIKD